MGVTLELSNARAIDEVVADAVIIPVSRASTEAPLRPACVVPDEETLLSLLPLMKLDKPGACGVVPSASAGGTWAAPLMVLVHVPSDEHAPTYSFALVQVLSRSFLRTGGLDAQRVALPVEAGTSRTRRRLLLDAATTAGYCYEEYRTKMKGSVTIVLTGVSQEDIDRARITEKATRITRDLVNCPPADMTPGDMADYAVEACREYGLPVRVLDERELEAERFAGLVAVGSGSKNPPRLVIIGDADPRPGGTAIVGKGITFDSGGLNVKPGLSMLTMKDDMAGAAAVLGFMVGMGALGLADGFQGYLACAENLLGSAAYRPSDVLRHRNGITTEVVSTDAEGRLVLADVLAYAAEKRPARIIDVATLTGSTGMGPDVWGAMGTDDELVRQLVAAGAAVGEPGWALPLWAGYRPSLDSDIADLKNLDADAGWGNHGILGGLFLAEFVPDVPWAHLDIAATAFREGDDDALGQRYGATGSPVRALIEWAERHAT